MNISFEIKHLLGENHFKELVRPFANSTLNRCSGVDIHNLVKGLMG
jgi:hypothetical protein